MQLIKRIWNNWQWVLPVVALLFSAFTYYYKTSTEIPAKIQYCEQRIARHEQESKEHFDKLDKSVADLNILNAGINAQLDSIKEDTSATKRLLFELLGKKL